MPTMIIAAVKARALRFIRRYDNRCTIHSVFPTVPARKQVLPTECAILNLHFLLPTGIILPHWIDTRLFGNPSIAIESARTLVRVGAIVIAQDTDTSRCDTTAETGDQGILCQKKCPQRKPNKNGTSGLRLRCQKISEMVSPDCLLNKAKPS